MTAGEHDITPQSTPPATAGPYSPSVRAGEWVVCSGQLGVHAGVLAEGVTAQVTQALDNLKVVLAPHGLGLRDVVKTTVFLSDIADFSDMNTAYMASFGDHRPARSAFAVAALPLGALVEIEAWAVIPQRV